MATTTTNFGWDIPQSTDLVKDGATAIAALGQDIDTAMVDLKGGTTGQVLSKASSTDLDFTWVAQDDSNAIQNAIVDAKGDLIAATAADTPARLAVGTNGQVLTADSTAATGLAWATAASGGMTVLASGSLSSTSLSLSSISGSYKDLQLVLRDFAISGGDVPILRFNSDSTSSAYQCVGYNRISNANVLAGETQNYMMMITNGMTTGSNKNALVLNVLDYANTTAYKLATIENTTDSSGARGVTINSFTGTWKNVAAINAISLSLASGTYSAGTYILYGVN